MRIVERFAQNPVTEEMIAIALPWLEREQFDDIPVERFAYKNCGYVLCKKSISEVSFNQKYRISVSRRRVYEVGDRKYFCSDWCYRASCYLRRQIPTEPTWCRVLPAPPMTNLKFLPADAPGRPGKTVMDALAIIRLNADIENTGANLKGEFSSSDEEDLAENFRKVNLDDDGNNDSDSSVESVKKSTASPWNEVIPQPARKTERIKERKAVGKSSDNSSGKESEKTLNSTERRQSKILEKKKGVKAQVDPKEVVLSRLEEWMTKEAMEMLYSEESSTSKSQATASLSEYESKVSAFFSNNEKDKERSNIVAPMVDSVSQENFRLKILMDSLLPNLKSILFRMDVSLNPTFDKLRNLLVRFNLTSKNLHIRPKELNIMSCSLLHLLNAKDPTVLSHEKIVEMLAPDFEGDKAATEAYLVKVMEIVDKRREESMDMPS